MITVLFLSMRMMPGALNEQRETCAMSGATVQSETIEPPVRVPYIRESGLGKQKCPIAAAVGGECLELGAVCCTRLPAEK